MLRRAGTLLVVVLVVASTLPAGPAAAQTATETATETSDRVDEVWFCPENGDPGTISYTLGCVIPLGSGSVSDDLNATDANETKSELYGSLASAEESAQIAIDSRNNSLEDSRSIALMEGKNAYIRALENDTTEATARQRAHGAVADYYSRHEVQALNQYTVQVEELERAYSHAEGTTGVDEGTFLKMTGQHTEGGDYQATNLSFESKSVTLSNGSTMTVPTIIGGANLRNEGVPADMWYDVHKEIGPETPDDSVVTDGATSQGSVNNIVVSSPYDGYSGSSFVYLAADSSIEYKNHLDQIDSQQDSVNGSVNQFVNETYPAWEEDEINSSDLVDPYLGARNYSPDEDFQTWAVSSSLAMGLSGPENISQHGYMNVSAGGENYSGVLMSDGLPESGGFTVGQTYDASTLTGSQYVLTTDGKEDLDGEFAITDAKTASGGNLSSVDYRQVRYDTTNISEFQQQMDEIQAAQTEIETRQQNIRSGIGGGGFLDGESGLVGAAILGGLLVVLLGRS